jgi:hypothetical protein
MHWQIEDGQMSAFDSLYVTEEFNEAVRVIRTTFP